MDALLAELRRAYAEAADFDRPWLVGTVVDTSRYSTVGASWVGLLYGDQAYQAMYSDGPRPDEGDELEFKRANRHRDSWYFARPKPQAQSCSAFVYVSAHDVSGGMGGEWAILRCATSTLAWTRRGAHPVVGDWDRRPLKGIAGFRLFTYGVNDDGTGSGLFYSDDGGATWAGGGLTGVLDVMVHSIRLTGAHGAMTAVAEDGASVWVSGDWGNTWAEDTRYAATGQHFYAATYAGQFFFLPALATSGVYAPDPFGMVGPVLPTSSDGGSMLAGSASGWFQIPGGVMEIEADSAFAFGGLDGGDISDPASAIPGGPHSGGWLGTGTGLYMYADGAGGRAYHVTSGAHSPIYDGATNHPAALAAGVRGFVLVAGAGDGVPPDDWPASVGEGCRFVAIDDDDPAHALFAIERGNAFNPSVQSPDPWLRADNTMAVDLGATYAASMQGVATLEIWDDNFGPE